LQISMASDNQAAAITDLVETALGNEDIAPLVRPAAKLGRCLLTA